MKFVTMQHPHATDGDGDPVTSDVPASRVEHLLGKDWKVVTGDTDEQNDPPATDPPATDQTDDDESDEGDEGDTSTTRSDLVDRFSTNRGG